MELPRPNGLVALLTDFGGEDPYVGVMKAAIKKTWLRADILDLCHGVPAHDVALAALALSAATGYLPSGTVVAAVVDPGVGTERRVLAACAHGCYWLAPDNGLLDPVLRAAEPCEVRAVEVERLRLRPPSRTFWGRDVFAPLAAQLCGGRIGFRALGDRAEPMALAQPALSPDAEPQVLTVDRFGNLISNVTAQRVASEGVAAVAVGGRRIALLGTYDDVAAGMPLALINSYSLLEVAVCRGRADQVLGIGTGAPIELLAS